MAPLVSRGIVGQVTSRAVVYDAETTSGGSGGPVLSLDGRVIAVNAAILPDFGGSNMGVPAEHGVTLMEWLNRSLHEGDPLDSAMFRRSPQEDMPPLMPVPFP